MGADEDKATLISEILDDAQEALERLRSQGYPNKRIDSRCDIHYGPEGEHDIWKELMYWEIPFRVQSHDDDGARNSIKLWSDGDIGVHTGLSAEQLTTVLNQLRQLGR